MKIVTIPHSTLRTVAQPVTHVDKKVIQFVQDLQTTLGKKNNPKGVGLAAPQVDVKWRIFATQLPEREDDEESYQMRSFINPKILDHSDQFTYGPDKKEPILEGCLSIPGIYGIVPRWNWIELEYQVIEGTELVTHKERFTDFAARVIQHEHDHLNGILFIDYSVEFDLPTYKENSRTEKLYELDPELLLALFQQSKKV
jgi:peptide deformylase